MEHNAISFARFREMMSFDTEKEYCIEIEFALGETDHCWMGKKPDKVTGTDVYWFGLPEKSGGVYSTFEAFSSAKVFDGKALYEVWATVTIWAIDGCDPMERLADYLS